MQKKEEEKRRMIKEQAEDEALEDKEVDALLAIGRLTSSTRGPSLCGLAGAGGGDGEDEEEEGADEKEEEEEQAQTSQTLFLSRCPHLET